MDTTTRQAEFFFKKYKTILFCILLIATVFGTYSRVITYDFVNIDDELYVTANAVVQQGFSTESLGYAFTITSKKMSYWHPLTWLSHMLDCQLFGLDAGRHHLTSILIHILNSLLLFLVFRSMTGQFLQSTLIAFLFALHPISVDSVAWIAERKSVLSTLFWMLTMLSYIFYSKKPGAGKYLMVFAVFTLGLLAKPMLITLPCVLLLMDFWPMNRLGLLSWQPTRETFTRTAWPRLIVEKVPFFVVSLIAIFVSSHSLKILGVYLTTAQVPMTIRIENAIVSYVKYIGKILYPENLAVYYPFPASVPLWQVIGASIVLVSISAMVISQLKARPWFTVGWFWFLGTLFPVSGLVQGGLWPEMADRWAYVPQIGIFIMIAWPISKLIDAAGLRGKVAAVTTGILLIALCTATWHQAGYWKNSKTLFTHALSVTGPNAIAHRNLGKDLLDKKDYDGAIEQFRKSIELNPFRAEVHSILGTALWAKRDSKAALQHYEHAIKLNPKEPLYYTRAGLILKETNKASQAIEYFKKVLAIQPEDVIARYNFGLCLAETGNFKAAEKQVLETLPLAPDRGEGLYNVGAFYGKYKKQDLAKFHLEKVLTINPEHPKANYDLGIIAMDQNRAKTAENHFLATLASAPDHIDARNNLGLLYSKTGRPGKAIQQFQKVLESDSRDNLARFNLADALVKANKAAAASRQFAEILAIDPDHEGARLGYDQTSKFLAAIDIEITRTEDLLRFDPESPALLVTLGDLYLNRGDVEHGIEYYRKVQNLYPDQPGVLNKIAAALSSIEDYEKALLYFKKSLALVPEKPEGYYNVACMYSRLDKTEQTLEWLTLAVEKGYDNWKQVKTDPDLENFRNTSVYEAFAENSGF